ncbi:hypothetical protein [Jongsikchunia kroppenstedtii]|nr:hypothetical protein [Jongsikchunia kroppenstedtii]
MTDPAAFDRLDQDSPRELVGPFGTGSPTPNCGERVAVADAVLPGVAP